MLPAFQLRNGRLPDPSALGPTPPAAPAQTGAPHIEDAEWSAQRNPSLSARTAECRCPSFAVRCEWSACAPVRVLFVAHDAAAVWGTAWFQIPQPDSGTTPAPADRSAPSHTDLKS